MIQEKLKIEQKAQINLKIYALILMGALRLILFNNKISLKHLIVALITPEDKEKIPRQENPFKLILAALASPLFQSQPLLKKNMNLLLQLVLGSLRNVGSELEDVK